MVVLVLFAIPWSRIPCSKRFDLFFFVFLCFCSSFVLIIALRGRLCWTRSFLSYRHPLGTVRDMIPLLITFSRRAMELRVSTTAAPLSWWKDKTGQTRQIRDRRTLFCSRLGPGGWLVTASWCVEWCSFGALLFFSTFLLFLFFHWFYLFRFLVSSSFVFIVVLIPSCSFSSLLKSEFKPPSSSPILILWLLWSIAPEHYWQG